MRAELATEKTVEKARLNAQLTRQKINSRLLKQWLTVQLHLLLVCGANQAIVDAGSHSADMFVRIDGIATLAQIEIKIVEDEEEE